MGFFGLRPKDRSKIHEQIFQLIYYGEGGFNHSDLYGMPTYLRNFYYKKLLEAKKLEKKQNEKNNKLAKPSFKKPTFKR